jgi:mono/diheme cytochrome c family protein
MLTKRNNMRLWGTMAAALGVTSLLSGCHLDMWIQPKAKPYYQSDFFSDQQASRPLVPGTVAQGALRLEDSYHTGREANGKPTKTIPASAVRSFESPKAMLLRGQERYNIYCQPCHGKNGNGNGMIMQRGLGYWQKVAASYQTPRLRKIEDGHIYDVITNGYGVMYGYAARIQDVNDRWAIVAYIRALQRAEAGVPSTPELEEKVKNSAANEDPSAGIGSEEPAGMSRAGETMKDDGAHGGNGGPNGE